MRYAFSAILALALAACAPTERPDEVDADTIKTLRVVGVGEVEVEPDRFVLSGAVIKREDDARTAMNAVADVVNAVQAAANDLPELSARDFNFASVQQVGVKDPECLLFNAEADRTNSTLRDDEARVRKRVCEDVAQQASLTFTFTGGPPDAAGDALAAFSSAGAIRLKLDGYRIDNLADVELQAGERAIANARQKAERLAEAGGARITGVLDLNSYNTTYDQGRARPPVVRTSGAGEGPSLIEGTEPVDVTAMNLEAGLQVVSAAVTLEFIYE